MRCRSCRGDDTCFVCRNRTKLKTNRKLKTEKGKMKTTNEFSLESLLLWVCLFHFGSAALAAGGADCQDAEDDDDDDDDADGSGSLPGQNSERD